jgi:hypothetical protein
VTFDLARSDALHHAVREVIARGASLEEPEVHALALDVARHQAASVEPLRRLLLARGIDLGRATRLDDVPALPTDVFKLRRVAAHPPELDVRVFLTSGTTVGARGAHPFRTLATYEAAALAWGTRWLLAGGPARSFVLAPTFEQAPESSLGFMIELFSRSLGVPTSFFLGPSGIDASALTAAARAAALADEPVIVFGTAFAYVFALDALGETALPLPAGSRALLTGGFKGRTREVPESELRRGIARLFALPSSRVIGEYGMTELSSQTYEPRLVEGDPPRDGTYVAPPWVQVVAVDPATLTPVAEGEIGIARIVDLANVDSALAVQTQDRVRVVGPGRFELLGRAPGAPPRGCSLAIEDIVAGDGS